MVDKITLKNIMIYDFMRSHITRSNLDVKAVFTANQKEIAERFGITSYSTFNFHIRKVLDWEGQGNSISVIKLDNKEVRNG